MNDLNILIVEGNLEEENKNFSDAGIQTHTESLKESLNFLSSSKLEKNSLAVLW